MKFNAGEKVKFLNDVGGGTITSVIDKNRVLVQTNDGFEIPVMITELVHDSYEDRTEEKIIPEIPPLIKEIITQTDEKIPQVYTEEEILFALMPVEKGSELFAYLINNSSYDLHYSISTEKESENLFFAHGALESGVKIRMRKFIPENISNPIRFNIQLILFKKDFYILKEPVFYSLYVKPADIYSGKDLIENDFFEKKAGIYPLINYSRKETIPQVDVSVKDRNSHEDRVRRANPPVNSENKPEEIDLHIEEIVEDYAKIDPAEILEIQISRFKTSLETAIIHKARRIVFIHGVGNGKLKYRIRKTLDENYPDLQYQDASFKEYGYGATMVILK